MVIVLLPQVFLTVNLQVPVYFTQAERQAILDAIDLAGLKPLALLDDGSAGTRILLTKNGPKLKSCLIVAVNYAMTRNFDQPENHVFYDAGAGSIRATVVAFQTKEVKEANSKTSRNVTTAEVIGVGFDRSAGGLIMDARIRDLLESQFNEKSGSQLENPVSEDKRAQVKLLKEAGRVKQVLSANAEAPSRIEGLAEDVDFRGSLTREAFEAACADLQPAFSEPISSALQYANLTMEDITSVILVGGTSRVPMVRNAVIALVGEDKVAQNLNADEAAVMGAALFGAGLSKQFRTKEIRLSGLSPYAMQIACASRKSSCGSSIRPLAHRLLTCRSSAPESQAIASTIFPANTKLGVLKTMTLKRESDFSVHFNYKPGQAAGMPVGSIADVHISGISAALANLTEAEISNTTVKVTVQLSSSGLLDIASAQLLLPEIKASGSVTDKLKGFFGGSKDKKDAENSAEETDESAKPAEEIQKKQAGPVQLTVNYLGNPFQALPATEKKLAVKR